MTVPICRWTTIPNQSIAGPTRVGISAHHIDGIERVEFAANGTKLPTVEYPTTNPETGHPDYGVVIDPAAHDSEYLYVAALVYRRGGAGYYHAGTLTLRNALTAPTAPEVAYCHPDGSDSDDGTPARPCATPSGAARAVCERHGGTLYAPLLIRLMGGTYDIGGKFWDEDQRPARGNIPHHWVTVEPEPDCEFAGPVIINAGDGGVTGAEWVRWRGVILDTDLGLRLTSQNLWIDRCVVRDEGPMDATATYLFKKPWSERIYITRSACSYRYGWSGADYVANSHIERCGKSALAYVPQVHGCTVGEFADTGGHGSVLKILLTDAQPVASNVIWEGVRAPHYPFQGVHIEDNSGLGRVEGLAWLDSIIRRRVPMETAGTSWIECPIDHAIIDGVDLGDQSLTFKGRGILHSARVRGCTFARWSGVPGLGGNAYSDENHWTDVRGYGAYRVGSDPRPCPYPICDTTTTNTNPGDPLYGVPDGVVDGADQSYYVERWLDATPDGPPEPWMKEALQ